MLGLFALLYEIWDAAAVNFTDLSARLGIVRPNGQTPGAVYRKALIRLLFAALLVPFPLLLLGMIGGIGWLIAIVGMFWGLCVLALVIVAAPLGVLLGVLFGETKESGARYLRFVLWIFLTVLTFTLFVAVVPIQNNLSALPVLIIACGVLGVLGALGTKTAFTQKLIGTFATLVVIALSISFLLPKSFSALDGVVEKADAKVERLLNPPPPTSEERASEISARPVVWYPEPFPLPEPGKFVPTVTNLDTTNFEPASYKVWAKKGEKYVRYRLLVTDPKTNIQAEVEMGPRKQWIHGSGGGIGQFPVAANESGVTFWAERVPRKLLNKRTM